MLLINIILASIMLLTLFCSKVSCAPLYFPHLQVSGDLSVVVFESRGHPEPATEAAAPSSFESVHNFNQ